MEISTLPALKYAKEPIIEIGITESAHVTKLSFFSFFVSLFKVSKIKIPPPVPKNPFNAPPINDKSVKRKMKSKKLNSFMLFTKTIKRFIKCKLRAWKMEIQIQ